MRIIYSYKGSQGKVAFPPGEILLGRPATSSEPDLDLSPDRDVSRRHAVVREVDSTITIEDLGSQFGTFVNGRRIADTIEITPEDMISIGSTVLQIFAGTAEQQAVVMAEEEEEPETVAVAIEDDGSCQYLPEDEQLAESELSESLFPDPGQARSRVLADILATNPTSQELYPFVSNLLARLMGVVTDAERGAILLLDRVTQRLVVVAYVAPGDAAVSQTLARKAMAELRPFLWRRLAARAPSDTAQQIQIKSAVYAPIVFQQRALGVLCVDSSTRDLAFNDDDLRLVRAGANAAGATIAAFEAQQQLALKMSGLQRLLYPFTAETIGNLVARSQRGALAPQAARTEVTLLWVGFSGFTLPAAMQNGAAVLEWWHEHWYLVLETIQKFGGTIERLAEDHLLVVFGSPEPDAKMYEHVVHAALGLAAELIRLRDRQLAAGGGKWEVRLAMHVGEPWQGFFGTPERMVFRVLGEPVEHVAQLARGAGPFELLSSKALQPIIAPMVQSEPLTVPGRQAGATMEAFRIKALPTAL